MNDVGIAVVGIAAVVAAGAYIRYGRRLSLTSSSDKQSFLSKHEGKELRLLVARHFGRAEVLSDISGVVRAATRRGVTFSASGRDRFVPYGQIRGANDSEGRPLKRW